MTYRCNLTATAARRAMREAPGAQIHAPSRSSGRHDDVCAYGCTHGICNSGAFAPCIYSQPAISPSTLAISATTDTFLRAKSRIPFSPALRYKSNSLLANCSRSFSAFSPLPCIFLNCLSAAITSAGGGCVSMCNWACRPNRMDRLWRRSAEERVWRASAPCWVCSRMRMLVFSRARWVDRVVDRALMRWSLTCWSSAGSVCVARS